MRDRKWSVTERRREGGGREGGGRKGGEVGREEGKGGEGGRGGNGGRNGRRGVSQNMST